MFFLPVLASALYHTTDHHLHQVPAVNTHHVLGQGLGQGHASEVWVAVPASAFGAGVDPHPLSWAQYHCSDLHLFFFGGGAGGGGIEGPVLGQVKLLLWVTGFQYFCWDVYFGASNYLSIFDLPKTELSVSQVLNTKLCFHFWRLYYSIQTSKSWVSALHSWWMLNYRIWGYEYWVAVI